MNKTKRRFTLFFWSGIVFILVANSLLWLYLNRVEKHFQEQLALRLSSIGRAINRQLDGDALNTIVPGNRFSLDYISLLTTLQGIQLQDSLQSIVLFSKGGQIIISVPEALAGKASSFATDTIFTRASRGETVLTGPRQVAGDMLLAVLSPVYDSDGFISGVQLVEARATYFETLGELRQQLLLYSLLTFIIIVIGAIYLYRQINSSIAYQAAIQEQAHLVELGTMAASVAHELRNPLGIIDASNDMIRKKYGNKKDEIFDYIPDEVRRLSLLIDNFLRFARSPRLEKKSFEIGALFTKVLSGYSEEQRNKIEFNLKKPLTLQSDPDALEQVLLNVTGNALQVIDKKKGRIKIDVNRKGKVIEIIVCDNGPGIPADIRDRIFRPFFTTRDKGTGLGLAICRRLCRPLGGNIELLDSDKGSCFKISVAQTINI